MPERTEAGPGGKVCIFCNIANGKIKSQRIYEDQDSIAFLDIHPRARGMSIVVPKEHFTDMHDNSLESFKVFQAADIVANMLKTSLDARFVEMGIIRSEDVNHFHIRLYPVYAEERPLFEGEALNMTEPELEALAEKIKSVEILSMGDRQEKKKKEGKSWDPEEAKAVRRSIEEA